MNAAWIKRLLDVAASAAGLLLLSPLFAVVAILIKLDDRGPVFYCQERVGRCFRPFRICKFRTMVVDADKRGGTVTVEGDARITRLGAFLRRSKIDELPQLFNVLRGDMSLVGPRPECGPYVQRFRADYEKLLRVRPGITDPASLRFSREEHLLADSTDPEEDYVNRVLPQKIGIALQYVERRTLLTDLKVIFETLFKVSAGNYY